MAASGFGLHVAMLVGISLGITVGVYGLVAGIVKRDDAGLCISTGNALAGPAAGLRVVGAFTLAKRLPTRVRPPTPHEVDAAGTDQSLSAASPVTACRQREYTRSRKPSDNCGT